MTDHRTLETQAAEHLRALAADLVDDLGDTSETELALLALMVAQMDSVLTDPGLRGARFLAHCWLDVLRGELIRRGHRAALEIQELQRIHSLETN